jgi:hypothetical protein
VSVSRELAEKTAGSSRNRKRQTKDRSRTGRPLVAHKK